MYQASSNVIWAGLLVSGACLFGADLARAGDPIVFSDRRVQVAPVPVQPEVEQLMERLDKVSAPTPYVGLTPGAPARRSVSQDSPRSRRARLAAKEKRNWMWYDEGELQERDDENRALGLTRFEISEEEQDPGLREDQPGSEGAPKSMSRDSSSRVPMHLRSPRQREKMREEAMRESRTRAEAKAKLAEEQENKSRERLAEAGASMHKSEELDMTTLLAPAKEAGALGSGGGQLGLRELLGNNATKRVLPELKLGSRMQGGPSGLDLSKPVLPPLIDRDSLNLRPNLGEDQLNALMSGSSGSDLDFSAGSGGSGSSLSRIGSGPPMRSAFSADLQQAGPLPGRAAGVTGLLPGRGIAPTPPGRFDPRSTPYDTRMGPADFRSAPRRGGTLGR